MTSKLTNKRIAEILSRAEVCDDSVLTDYADIAAAMRELQEYRKAPAKTITLPVPSTPDGYHIINESGEVCADRKTLSEAQQVVSGWNSNWVIKPYYYEKI